MRRIFALPGGQQGTTASQNHKRKGIMRRLREAFEVLCHGCRRTVECPCSSPHDSPQCGVRFEIRLARSVGRNRHKKLQPGASGAIMRSSEKEKGTPHEQRRGWLKNGNPAGDFTKAPRCGAKTRRGTPCQCPAMINGRCRLHGGRSSGPKTPAGRKRISETNRKHGAYSLEREAEITEYRRQLQSVRESNRQLQDQ
jgi:hypothetical protein